jgi:hypothetical protein
LGGPAVADLPAGTRAREATRMARAGSAAGARRAFPQARPLS